MGRRVRLTLPLPCILVIFNVDLRYWLRVIEAEMLLLIYYLLGEGAGCLDVAVML